MPISPNKAEKYIQERFGVEVSAINLEKINGDYWLASEESSGLEFETRGIRAVRDMDVGLKPTTYFLQLLGEEITKNVVQVSQKDLECLNGGEMIQRELDEKGYVALRFEERVFGCGFYMDGLVSSRIPEGRLDELVHSL